MLILLMALLSRWLSVLWGLLSGRPHDIIQTHKGVIPMNNDRIDKFEEKMDTRLQEMDAKFDARLERMDAKFDALVNMMGNMSIQITRLTEDLANFKAETAANFASVRSDIKDIKDRLEVTGEKVDTLIHLYNTGEIGKSPLKILK